MSDIQLPDYPWEHPRESDYEEARAMSDPEVEAFRELHGRIAELEAERDKLTIENVDLAISTGKRRAELEAEVKRLTDTLAEAVVDAAYWKRRATRNAP